IISFPRMVGDSYMYMPLVGLLLAGAAWSLPVLVGASQAIRRGCLVALVLVCCVLGWRAADQTRRWASPVTLWYPATQIHRDWPYAWMHIAVGLRFLGEMERAEHAWGQFYAREYTRDFLHKVALLYVEMDRI